MDEQKSMDAGQDVAETEQDVAEIEPVEQTEPAPAKVVEAQPEHEFVNEYEITREMYLDWASHPVGATAKKRARTMNIMTVVELVVALAFAAFGVIKGQPLYLIVGGIFAVYLVLNITLLQRMKYAKAFYDLLKQHKTDRWLRVMRFGDSIEVSDAGTPVRFGWDRVVTVTQDKNWIYLWINPSSAYRVKRDAFTKGSAEAFTAFAGRQMKKK